MPDESRPAVGDKVRAIRELHGWSQAELARRAKMDRAHLARIEDGSYRSPRPENIEKLARALNVETDELTGRTSLRQITPYEANAQYRKLIDALESVDGVDREEIIRHALWSANRLTPGIELPNVATFRLRAVAGDTLADRPFGDVIRDAPWEDSGDFPPLPIAPEDFIEKDTDTPRPLHAWVVPIAAEAAAGLPRNPDDILIPTTQLLNTFREVRDDRTHVIKIIGHSMHPTLRNGWKVLIDPAKSLFQPGKIVMVYLLDEGSTIGLLAKSGNDFKIVKRNSDYGGPIEIPLRAGEWYPVGTVTTIVEAPVEIE